MQRGGRADASVAPRRTKVKKEENKEVGKDTLEKTHIQMERKCDVGGEKL